MNSIPRRVALILGAILLVGVLIAATAAAQSNRKSFKILRPVAAPQGCLKNARGDVDIRSLGPVEILTVGVKGMPPNRTFNLFVTQLPQEPYGIAWYQGAIRTNGNGNGERNFVGRFNVETFAVAPDKGSAPVIDDDGPFPDASKNPQFDPIHTYHLTLWFESPGAAEESGCPGTVFPFDGDHRAGIKALSTRNFPDAKGPLRSIKP